MLLGSFGPSKVAYKAKNNVTTVETYLLDRN